MNVSSVLSLWMLHYAIHLKAIYVLYLCSVVSTRGIQNNVKGHSPLCFLLPGLSLFELVGEFRSRNLFHLMIKIFYLFDCYTHAAVGLTNVFYSPELCSTSASPQDVSVHHRITDQCTSRHTAALTTRRRPIIIYIYHNNVAQTEPPVYPFYIIFHIHNTLI